MDKKKIVRDGYNKAAEKYLEMRHEDLPEFEILVEFRNEFEARTGRILDAGCGAGLPFTKYLSKFFEVVGIDISDKQIELAKKNVPNAVFYREDMTNLDFQDESFIGIIALYSIIHVPREEHKEIFENFYRMLKKDGLMLVCLHSKDDPGFKIDDFFGEEMYWSGFDRKTNLSLITDVGFNIMWEKLVGDSLGDSKHLFVLARKE